MMERSVFLACLLMALLFLSFRPAHAGCSGTSDSKCKIRDRVGMLFQFEQGATPKYIRADPRVDEFSMVEAYQLTPIIASGDTTVTVTVGGKSASRFVEREGKYTPFLIVAVQWIDGKVDDVKFVDTCESGDCTLGDHSCVGSSDTTQNCGESAGGCAGTDCDTKFYIVHVGNDKTNEWMTSYDMLPTRFTSYSVGDIYNNMK